MTVPFFPGRRHLLREFRIAAPLRSRDCWWCRAAEMPVASWF
jgi:hypothetical protein